MLRSRPLRVRGGGWSLLRRVNSAALPFAGHAALVLWALWGPLVGGRVLYFRDTTFIYVPDLAFFGRWLSQGVWPLWNPLADAGVPFLVTYPFEVLFAWLFDPATAVAAVAAVDLMVGASGVSALAAVYGLGRMGRWAAGAVHLAAGYTLSCVGLLPYLHGIAWAPWVAAVALRVVRGPSRSATVALAAVAAVMVATQAVEPALQSAILFTALVPWASLRRAGSRLVLAATLAACLAAPALLGMTDALRGTARARGFPREHVLGWSAHPMTFAECLLPRFFGDVHTFSDYGYWGQPFFPGQYPYLPSLYLGPCVLLLAACGGASRRLFVVAALGVLLSMGEHGPLAFFLPMFGRLRTPVKFFWLTTVAIALLAGRGLERGRGRPTSLFALVPGAMVFVAGGVLWWRPSLATALAGSVPAAAAARMQDVAMRMWPEAFLTTGALAFGTGLALFKGRRLAPLALAFTLCDLAIVNVVINPSTDRSFFALRPEVARLVASVASDEPARWFSLATVTSAPLHWDPALVARNDDVWLYYALRQALMPRTHVLDGVEGAFDEDRTGLAPEGASLHANVRRPEMLALVYHRLRLGNVRWIVGFERLPDTLATLRASASVPWIREPFLLSELRHALPRAFFVPRAEVVADRAALWRRLTVGDFDVRGTVLLDAVPPQVTVAERGPLPEANVRYERPDPHTVVLHASTPPGFLVVVDGYHPGWTGSDPTGRPVPVLRANGRYWAIPTAGGEQRYLVEYRPRWVGPGLALLAVGVLGSIAVLRWPSGWPLGGGPGTLDTPERAS